MNVQTGNYTSATQYSPLQSGVLSREQAFERFAGLQCVVADIEQLQRDSDLSAIALVKNTDDVLDASGSWTLPRTLILALPACFAPMLDKLIATPAKLQKLMTLDLREGHGVLGWGLPGVATVMVSAAEFEGMVVAESGPYLDMANVPVIMLAADTVAIGGVGLDQGWREYFRDLAHGTGRFWNPQEYFTEQALEEGAQQARMHGRAPFLGQAWQEPGAEELSVLVPMTTDLQSTRCGAFL